MGGKNIEQQFFQFIYKRQLIWYRRFILREPFPWTDDNILQTYKFINMYRELDRCTQYIVKKLSGITDRHALLLNIVFYRFFNLFELYEMLEIEPMYKMDEQQAKILIRRFDLLKQSGKVIFNNAYIISPGAQKIPKHIAILHTITQVNFDDLIQKMDASASPKESFDVLLQIPLAGPFLAGEFWTDLTYFHFFQQGWTDNDFVSIGPGAKWGLKILYGAMTPKEYLQKLRHLHTVQQEALPTIHESLQEKLPWKNIAYKQAESNVPFLSLTNMEGALCEFRKYWNLRQGRGRKRYYHLHETQKRGRS